MFVIDLHGGQINGPLLGKRYSISFIPATPSSPSRTLEGLFELTQRSSRALDSPRALLRESRTQVRCGQEPLNPPLYDPPELQ